MFEAVPQLNNVNTSCGLIERFELQVLVDMAVNTAHRLMQSSVVLTGTEEAKYYQLEQQIQVVPESYFFLERKEEIGPKKKAWIRYGKENEKPGEGMECNIHFHTYENAHLHSRLLELTCCCIAKLLA
jgi:hypothetical protein